MRSGAVDLTFIIAGILVVALAGAVQGLTGFGSALIMVPVLSLFLLPREVVPVTLVLGTIINAAVLVQARRSLDWKMVLPIFIPAALAIPVGTALLIILPAPVLRMSMGLVVLLTSIALLAGMSVKIERERLASIPVGLLSGILQGSVTMSGPPLILFFQNQGMERDRFRANLVAFFLASNVITGIAYIASGVLTPRSAAPAVIFLPALVIGLMLGMAVAGRIQDAPFRKLALIIVALAGVSSIASGIAGL
jgi:uncharacterized membrane protein YfcA